MRTRHLIPMNKDHSLITRAEARRNRSAHVAALSPDDRRAAEQALARWPELWPTTPHIIGSYRAIGDEISPHALEEQARARGWRIAYPRVTGASPLTFHETPPERLVPGFRGIPEPLPTLPPVLPRMLLVPLLLADSAGNRVGQGGGHYDRTIANLRSQGALFALGLGWDVQMVETLRPEPWDARLDAIATPSRFYRAATGATSSA